MSFHRQHSRVLACFVKLAKSDHFSASDCLAGIFSLCTGSIAECL